MNENAVLVEVVDRIAILTINRPKALNALNAEVFDGLDEFFSEAYEGLDICGVIITGSGEKAFAAGADITKFLELDAITGSILSKRGQDVFFKIENFHVPVIAAVNGFSLGGGCELAMACHMRVASDNAKFGQPEVNLGLIPGYGGSQRLIQYIGKSKAMELLLTGDMIGAAEAHTLGLVNHVVPQGEELTKSKEILTKIGTKGPLAVAKTIECVNLYFKNDTGFDFEAQEFGVLMESEDGREGATAFMEKRKANFKGK
jgi:enoyl-CoA hydratase